MKNLDLNVKGIELGLPVLAATAVMVGLNTVGVISVCWWGLFLPLMTWFIMVMFRAMLLVVTKAVMKRNFTDKQRQAYDAARNLKHMSDTDAVLLALEIK